MGPRSDLLPGRAAFGRAPRSSQRDSPDLRVPRERSPGDSQHRHARYVRDQRTRDNTWCRPQRRWHAERRATRTCSDGPGPIWLARLVRRDCFGRGKVELRVRSSQCRAHTGDRPGHHPSERRTVIAGMAHCYRRPGLPDASHGGRVAVVWWSPRSRRAGVDRRWPQGQHDRQVALRNREARTRWVNPRFHGTDHLAVLLQPTRRRG